MKQHAGSVGVALSDNHVCPTYVKKLPAETPIKYEADEERTSWKLSAGAAHGSILGPGLRNFSYDSIRRTEIPPRAFLVGYAHDVAIAYIKLNQVMGQI